MPVHQTTKLFMRKILIVLTIALSVFYLQGCYYDKADLVYPKSDCDTTGMTYTSDIQSIITTRCSGCHNGTASISGVDLMNYQQLKLRADNGVLLDRITTTDMSKLMPQGGPRLPDCEINKIKAWMNRNSPN